MASSNSFSALIITDNTGSMGAACTAAKQTFHEVRAQLNLLMGHECVEVAVVGDYDLATPNHQLGGWTVLPKGSSAKEIETFMATYVRPLGGGGIPEAYKTAFNFIIKMTEHPSTVFMFCDAIPHGIKSSLDSEGHKELAFIEANNMIWDWDTLCTTVKSLNIRVVTFLTASDASIIQVWRTMGDVVCMNINQPAAITKAMLCTFNALTGQSQADLSCTEFKCDSVITPLVKIDLESNLKSANPEVVLMAFDSLLDVRVPERALCLTTNDVLGKYWRQICGKIKFMDGRKHETRCQKVMDTLSFCMDKLSASDKAKLKDWINRSHNETGMSSSSQIISLIVTPILVTEKMVSGAIRELVQDGLLANATHFLILPKNLASTITLDDVLELGRGGGFC